MNKFEQTIQNIFHDEVIDIKIGKTRFDKKLYSGNWHFGVVRAYSKNTGGDIFFTDVMKFIDADYRSALIDSLKENNK